ncbi:MAG: lipid-A-disaccharide synthase [Enterobacterales bacterium]|nr:lipid-A-disaccharide synthase [Enterobacterales bacterium]
MSNTTPKRIAIVAGESSGDNLGSSLIDSLKKHYPDCQFIGIGGPKMQAVGCQSLYPMETLSVIGIGAILKRLPQLLKMRKELAYQLIEASVDLFIGIDAPEFNLGLEQMLKDEGVRTVHYVSPSVWAWRRKRIFKIKDCVDLMITLFPFETAIYEEHHIPVTCVGHSLAYEFDMQPDTFSARQALDIAEDAQVLAVMPGSRMSEIDYLGQLFLEVTAVMQQENPEMLALIPAANERTKARMEDFMKGMEQPPKIRCVLGDAKQVMTASNVVLLASGTAALEAMLLKKPMVVAYKVSWFSYQIYKRLVSLQYFSLPNLLAGHELVREFIQSEAEVEPICEQLSRLFRHGLTEQLQADFSHLHKDLMLGGADKAADEIKSYFFSGNNSE